MKAKRHPITAEHSAFYREALVKWQRKLNLDDWRVEFSDEPAAGRVMAEVNIQHADRLATFHLGKTWREAPTEHELERTAVHELLHVRLADVIHAARGKDAKALDSAEHAVIVLLEKILIPAPK